MLFFFIQIKETLRLS